jgi:hypothetical protein
VALFAAVPVLWFGGDWWGSGSPWHGADAARVVASDGQRVSDALVRVVDMVPWVVWIAAAFAVVRAVRRRDRVVPALAVLAGSWCALVVVMSAVFGYAALSRFLLPAAALVCVLAGAGTVWAVTSLWHRHALLGALVIAVVIASVAVRASAFPALFDELETRDRLVQGLDPAIDAVRATHAMTTCGVVAIASDEVPRIALAWKLDLPMAEVARALPPEGGVIFVSEGREAARRRERVIRRFGADAVQVVATTPEWTVLGAGCPSGPKVT